jgi:hypothetical protein
MNPKKVSIEHVLFITAFALAVALRFYQLGAAPLTDDEALWANQSIMVSQWDPQVEIGSNPGYVMLTGALFSIVGASEFPARFWPALAGSLLILAPWLLRKTWDNTQLARVTLLVLAFGLALDPGLVTLSRQAGGPMMAIGFSMVALALYTRHSYILSGFFAGLALLSGPAILSGIISLGFSVVVMWVSTKLASPQSSNSAFEAQQLPKIQATRFLVACFGTILITATFFFRFPQGLGAWLTSIQVSLEGWLVASENPIGLIFLAFFAFEMLPIVFFLAASGRRLVEYFQDRSSAHPWISFAYIWLTFSLLLVVVYPSREVASLGWSIVPLWFIAARELAILLPAKQTSPISVILAIFTFFLMSLFWLTLSAISKLSVTDVSLDLRLLVPVGVLVLIGLSAALVSLGWTSEVGQKGLAWGLCTALVIYSFSVLSGASYLRQNNPVELWGSQPGSGQNRLFEQTLEGISRQLTGFKYAADIVATPDSATLRWTLRNYSQSRIMNDLPPGELPSIVITPAEQEFPALSAAYTGQDFTWWTWRGWPGRVPANPVRWLNYREAPVQIQKIILWVRSDLLPGAIPSDPALLENP